MVLKVLDVDGVVQRVKGGWLSTGQEWSYDRDRYKRIEAARQAEQQAIIDYQRTTGCRMEFLLRQLDDPHAAPCGRCDNCTSTSWDAQVSEELVGAALERLRRPGVEVAPRKQWPPGMSTVGVSLSGKIPPAQSAQPGRAVGRLTDIGWGNRLRELFATGEDGSVADQPLPEDLFGACVGVLAKWEWGERPVGVVSVGSHRRPVLVRNIAERLAAVGRLPFLGTMELSGPTGHRANSAQRLAQLTEVLTVPDDVAARLSEVEGPVLLVDDQVDTGWTMTVAAKLLRDAGAASVLPFALATTS
jgi:ATP-dependent DNA helicase RecQ